MRKEGEDIDAVKKRFFRSLPPATGTLRMVQLALTQLLHEFDELCCENGIDYWISCGTVLGAVRHGGFIPWDDDVDLCMMREDIARLETLVENSDR
ncbi:MAG: LicD family protein, partial [Eggerthellaceae bacterium]|nr:LicD family protein [Eggerthellaceae bacterium]